MLILSRKAGESITIGDNIRVTLLEIHNKQVKVGIDAPRSVTVHREEVYVKIVEQNRLAIEESKKVDLIQLAKMLQQNQG